MQTTICSPVMRFPFDRDVHAELKTIGKEEGLT